MRLFILALLTTLFLATSCRTIIIPPRINNEVAVADDDIRHACDESLTIEVWQETEAHRTASEWLALCPDVQHTVALYAAVSKNIAVISTPVWERNVDLLQKEVELLRDRIDLIAKQDPERDMPGIVNQVLGVMMESEVMQHAFPVGNCLVAHILSLHPITHDGGGGGDSTPMVHPEVRIHTFDHQNLDFSDAYKWLQPIPVAILQASQSIEKVRLGNKSHHVAWVFYQADMANPFNMVSGTCLQWNGPLAEIPELAEIVR